MKSLALFVLLALFTTSHVRCQSPLFVFEGSQDDEMFGEAVACAGDVNGDGLDDLIVGSPLFDGAAGVDSGRFVVYSGADGSVLMSKEGGSADEHLGAAVAGAGDVNGDGFDDVIVGAPNATVVALEEGYAVVRSGLDGTVLHTFFGATVRGNLGGALLGLPDLDGDGRPDVAVGQPGINAQVTVRSGATGAVIWNTIGVPNARFGSSLASPGDLDGDMVCDVVVGAPFAPLMGFAFPAGAVLALSGANGNLIWKVLGTPFFLTGFDLAPAGDINGDGTPDVFATNGPHYITLCGVSGAQVALSPLQSAFVNVLEALGDLDGDGAFEVAAGAADHAVGPVAAGAAGIHRGSDGALLAWIGGAAADNLAGSAVAALGDLNGDGSVEVAIGSPRATTSTSNGARRGRVRIISGALPAYPGSREDLVMHAVVNGEPAGLELVVPLAANDLIELTLFSPTTAHEGRLPVVFGQFFATGAPPASPPGFPEIHVNPSDVFVIWDGSMAGPLGSSLLPAQGVSFLFQVAPGLSGFSAIVQSVVLSPSAANGIFVSTNGVELRFI